MNLLLANHPLPVWICSLQSGGRGSPAEAGPDMGWETPRLFGSRENVVASALQFWKNHLLSQPVSSPITLPTSSGVRVQGQKDSNAKHEVCHHRLFIEHLLCARALKIHQ